MILTFLRYVAFTLMFVFIYRIIVGALRYISGEDKKSARGNIPQPPDEQKKPDAAAYPDVKDAEFKDLPPDSAKPS